MIVGEIMMYTLDVNKLLLKKAKSYVAYYVNKDSYKHAVVGIQTNYINKLINVGEILLARKLSNELLDDLINTKILLRG